LNWIVGEAKVFKLSWTVTVILAGCLPALAQCPCPPLAPCPCPIEYRDWELSPFGGASILDGSEFSTPVTGSAIETSREVGIEYRPGYQIGLRLTQYLGDFWGADIEYSFANQPLRFTNLTPQIPTLALSHSLNHWSYSVSSLPLPGYKRFRPYIKLGMGASLYYIHESSKDAALAEGVALRNSWKYTVNLGGGFKYLIEDQFAVTLDVRDQMTGVPSYGLPPAATVVNGQFEPGFARRGLQNNWQFNLGASFQFDDYY
jgi:hypothetical protein